MAVQINLGNSLFNKEQRINDLTDQNQHLQEKGLQLIDEITAIKNTNAEMTRNFARLSNEKKLLEIDYEKVRLTN